MSFRLMTMRAGARRRLMMPTARQVSGGTLSKRLLAPTCSAHFCHLMNQNICFFSDDTNKTSGIAVVRRKGKATGYCYGCGADLVKASSGESSNMIKTIPKKKGYWAEKQDELKKSQLKNWALCPRCAKLNSINKSSGASIQDIQALGPDTKMTAVFRNQVSKIRSKQNAVVVLCVDAINISGTLIKTIRNYVGGNPILLAITRCDLLPTYIWESNNNNNVENLKQTFLTQAAEIQPAQVYLCSEDSSFQQQTAGGLTELGQDLWNHLNGRDPYIVGAANIGKSTLTDILISNFCQQGEQQGHFDGRDRLGRKRLEKLKETRITKSALPGTTLQNVRVPCFSDHTQALWDTPGLLLDESLKHFPIRNFRTIRAQRPMQIEPHFFEEYNLKSFALLICEEGDDLPLLRIEIRLKKSAQGEGPVRLVWNSTLNLDTKIVDIDRAVREERERSQQVKEEESRRKQQAQEESSSQVKETSLSKKEKAKRKEERRKQYEKRIKQEKAKLGKKEWNRLEEKRKTEWEEKRRVQTLAQLDNVHEVILERNEGIDVAIANFGWLGVLAPRTCLIRTYAPSSGVRVSHHDTIGLPKDWGEYKRGTGKKAGDEDSDEDSEEDDDEFDDWDEVPLDEFEEDVWSDDVFDEYDDYTDTSDSRPWKRRGKSRPQQIDIWEEFSGKNVGWQFDEDTRYSKGELQDGWNPLRKSSEKEQVAS